MGTGRSAVHKRETRTAAAAAVAGGARQRAGWRVPSSWLLCYMQGVPPIARWAPPPSPSTPIPHPAAVTRREWAAAAALEATVSSGRGAGTAQRCAAASGRGQRRLATHPASTLGAGEARGWNWLARQRSVAATHPCQVRHVARRTESTQCIQVLSTYVLSGRVLCFNAQVRVKLECCLHKIVGVVHIRRGNGQTFHEE